MRALAFICFAVAAPDAWALLDARRVRRSNRLLSTANFGQHKVTAADAAEDDKFGRSVAIDGSTVVVGSEKGAYVLRTTDGGATYVEVAKLTASDGSLNDYLGASVAIDGDTIVIGAYKDNSGRGSAYIFRTSDGGATYDQVAKLTSDAATYDDFGLAVAIDGNTVVVGADQFTTGSGVVYVFRTTDGGATYGQVAELTASDPQSWTRYGFSVAIAGNTVVVGAYYKPPGSSKGAVYVFRTNDGGATYGQVAKLTASDAASGDSFGYSVAIDGDTVVVGARGDSDHNSGSGWGFACVFRTTDGGATYDQVAKLTAADAASYDYFGYSVAIDGNAVVVGAYGDDDAGYSSGSAYVFRTDDGGATYVEVAKLTASDAAASDGFGNSVAIDGNTVVVGASNDDDAGSNSGSAYVFSPPAPTVQPTPRPTFQPTTPQPTMSPKPTPQPTTPQPSTAALGSDSATRAGGTLATALLAFAATALAL